jgi:eukaryotic-like serine/threonine-protein kinase
MMSWEPLRDDPDELGGYRLSGRLGAGGMGRVYLASTSAGRPVALKVLRPELGGNPEFRERFRQEITAARRVNGLYTAQVLDANPDGSPPWLVTAYVPGPSLAEAVSGHGPWPEQSVLLLVAGVAEALQAIHAVGLVHRDLKPSNVLLAADGPRVIDFGIARAVQEPGLTRTGMLVGSPQFISPEQAWGGAVTSAADVFALGGLAAYAATGRFPFGTGDATAVLYRVMHQDPDVGGCPDQLLAVIRPCLAKDPTARPTPAQVIEQCRALVPSRTLVFTPSWLPPAVAADLGSQAGPGPLAAPGTLLETGLPQTAAGPHGTARLPDGGWPPGTTMRYGSGMPSGSATSPRRRMPHMALAALVAAGVLVAALAVIGLAVALNQYGSSANNANLDSCLFGTWVMSSESNQLPDGQWETYTGGGATMTFLPSGVASTNYGNGSPQSVTVNGTTWTYVWVGSFSSRYSTSHGKYQLLDQSGYLTQTELENGSYYSKMSFPVTGNQGPLPYTCSAQKLQLSEPGPNTYVLTRKS